MTDLDTFAEDARLIFRHAEEHARRTGQNYLGTEHILLGLLDTPETTAHAIVRTLGANPNRVRESAEYVIAGGNGETTGRIRFTPRAITVIDLTIDEAATLGHNPIGPEHVLLGLLREKDGIAAGILEGVGVTLDTARVEVARLHDVEPGTAPLKLDLEQLTEIDRQRQEIVGLIDQVRWTPERIAAFTRLLTTMLD